MRTWVIVITTIGLSAMLFFVVYTQGHVSGREFAPSHFQTREFSFYEIPLLHVQITPIKRSGHALGAATHIRQSHINTPPGPPEIWHLVYLSRGLSGTTPADAELLTAQLEMQLNTTSYWRKWNIDHPKSANVLWPTIQRLAQRELYVLVPMVLELAQQANTSDELAQRIDQTLETEYKSLITDMREAGREELADQLLQEARVDFPDSQTLKQL